jgi:molybdenum cofactor synthesis domain-containing protein
VIVAAVITCSNRSAAGERADTSGELVAAALTSMGYAVESRAVVPDDVERIRAAVRAAIDAGARIVITTGGTGVTPNDVTPEALAPLIERELPGVADAIRLAGVTKVPTAVLSRGVAGTIGRSFVAALPGSPGGAQDGMRVLEPLLDHLVDQLSGGDH